MQRDEQNALLAETLARHFPAARARGGEVDLGFGDLRATTEVGAIKHVGQLVSASLFLYLVGGKLGPAPVFASISGYADSPEAAIVSGGCNWACVFGPVLLAALADEELPKVERFEATIHGQRFRLFVDGLERALSSSSTPAESTSARSAAMRERWGAHPWLAKAIVDAGQLPLLPANRATVLSVFASDTPGNRVVEVKVNGRNWAGSDQVFAAAPSEPDGAVLMLREFVVAVPIGAAPALRRDPLASTLAGISKESSGETRSSGSWRGWKAHAGTLGPALTPSDLTQLERDVGGLPDDYRAFLGDVAASGGGPGYGLLSPLGSPQTALARRGIPLPEESKRGEVLDGVLALAHAGCGMMWLLEVRGPGRGRVWLDARSGDGTMRVVYPSFDAWYRDWLDATLRDVGPWSSWDGLRCATASVLVQLLESLKKKGELPAEKPLVGRVGAGKLMLAASGSAYFVQGAHLDPCHPCVALAARLGLDEGIFGPGVPPLEGSAEPQPKPPGGGFGGWLRRLRGSA